MDIKITLLVIISLASLCSALNLKRRLDSEEKEKTTSLSHATPITEAVEELLATMPRDKREAPTIHIIRARRPPKPRVRRRRPSTKYGPPNKPSYKPISHYTPQNFEDAFKETYEDSYAPVKENYKLQYSVPSYNSQPTFASQINQFGGGGGGGLGGGLYSNNFGSYSQNYNQQSKYNFPSSQSSKKKPKKNAGEAIASIYQIPNNGQFAEPPSFDQQKLAGYLQNDNPIPTHQIPLEDNFNPNLYKNSISSYDVPLNYKLKSPSTASTYYEMNPQSSKKMKNQNINNDDFGGSYDFDDTYDIPSLPSPPTNKNKNSNNNNNNYNQNSFSQSNNFNSQNNNHNNHNNYFPPNLPNQYDQEQFKTPTKTNPNQRYPYLDDIANFQSFFDDPSESQNVAVKTKNNQKKSKNNNYNYLAAFNSGSIKDLKLSPYENDFLSSPVRTTTMPTTTKSKKQKSRRRKRPRMPTTTPHILDTDALREAYGDSSDFHQVALTAEDFLEFEPKKSISYSIDPTARSEYVQSKSKLPSTNFVLLSSGNTDKNKGKSVAPQTFPKKSYGRNRNNQQQQQQNKETFDIISIQKSKSKSFYGGTVKPQVFQSNQSYDDEDEDEDESISARMDEDELDDDMGLVQSGIFLAEHGFNNQNNNRFKVNSRFRAKKDINKDESVPTQNHKLP